MNRLSIQSIAVLTFILMTTITVINAEKEQPLNAIAYVEGSNGAVKGNVTFTQKACGELVYIRVSVNGLKPGSHGFHVHEKGDLTNGCLSMGAHYNPDKMDHGAPNDEIRHVGDLGNIIANEYGQVDTTITDHLISLTGHRSIIGRGLVIHAEEDDLGRTDHPESKKTGNAGGRVACGVIGINSDVNWTCSAANQILFNKSYIFIFLSITILSAFFTWC